MAEDTILCCPAVVFSEEVELLQIFTLKAMSSMLAILTRSLQYSRVWMETSTTCGGGFQLILCLAAVASTSLSHLVKGGHASRPQTWGLFDSFKNNADEDNDRVVLFAAAGRGERAVDTANDKIVDNTSMVPDSLKSIMCSPVPGNVQRMVSKMQSARNAEILPSITKLTSAAFSAMGIDTQAKTFERVKLVWRRRISRDRPIAAKLSGLELDVLREHIDCKLPDSDGRGEM
ncbi:hypothetical protein MKZ38_009791 [Zalerion maritima]|uniref:Uncharacterized protein n=1 Tax=Zalerion maritima TaxID=339359 RepID=A0AAD5RYE2_9PEZI|nr:hypothetical protein MKZ38_009791 [Zalerion maritima]